MHTIQIKCQSIFSHDSTEQNDIRMLQFNCFLLNTYMKKSCKHRVSGLGDTVHQKHYENMPILIYWKFYHLKMKIFR